VGLHSKSNKQSRYFQYKKIYAATSASRNGKPRQNRYSYCTFWDFGSLNERLGCVFITTWKINKSRRKRLQIYAVVFNSEIMVRGASKFIRRTATESHNSWNHKVARSTYCKKKKQKKECFSADQQRLFFPWYGDGVGDSAAEGGGPYGGVAAWHDGRHLQEQPSCI
jgi:hypothetical protein